MTKPIKIHGGKDPLAKKIIALFPPRCVNPNSPVTLDKGYLHYVEPYFGGGSVMLENDPVGISEVANDLNGDLSNFWLTLQSGDTWADFVRVMQATPFSEKEFLLAKKATVFGDDADRAANFFIMCRQSLAGRMQSFAPRSRVRTRKGMNEQVSAWLNAIEGLPEVHARLKRVLILNQPAIEVIKKEDGPRTLYYLDPPYHHDSRSTRSEYGDFEMSNHDHNELIRTLEGIKGRFLLSGYRNALYDSDSFLKQCNRVEFDVPNNAASGKKKQRKVECVWLNY